MTGKVLRRTIAVLFAASLALQPTLALANHQANCSEYGTVSRRMGYLSDSWAAHRYGVKAFLDNQTLDLCLNPRVGEGSASTAWVAIQGPLTSLDYPYNIVQMGMGRCRSGTGCDSTVIQDVYAWGRDDVAPGCQGWMRVAPTGRWLGSWSNGGSYSVQEDVNGKFTLKSLDWTVLIGTNSICWTNHTVAIFTETHDFGDAMGGTPGDHFNFQFRKAQITPGGPWQDLQALCNARNPANLSTIFKCAPNGVVLEMWTQR